MDDILLKARIYKGKGEERMANMHKGPEDLRAPYDQGLPNFHALYDQGFRAARGTLPEAPARMETAGHDRLSEDVSDLVVNYDEATRLPNFVASREPAARLSTSPADSPEDACVQFIRDRGDLWNLTPEDTATVEVVSVSRRGLPTVNLIQRVEGKEVFNSDVSAGVSPNNEVISVAGRRGGRSSTDVRTSGEGQRRDVPAGRTTVRSRLLHRTLDRRFSHLRLRR
jgi:hypothetical protein